MIRIALTGVQLSANLGGPSLLVSTRDVLSTVFPDATYTLFVPPYSYESDALLAAAYGVKVTPFRVGKWTFAWALLRRYTGILVGHASSKATIEALEQTDVVIDIRGILYSVVADNTAPRSMFLGFRAGMRELLTFALGKVLGKPVIKYTSALGPFNVMWHRVFAKLYLGRLVDLILARDEISRQEVEQLRIETPVLTIPDTAFLLSTYSSTESEHFAELRRESHLIGISVSYQARNRAPDCVDYIAIMTDFIGHVIAKHGAHVVLIPNELAEGGNSDDDRRVAEEIWTNVNDEYCEILRTEDLLAQEVKGVISRCEAIVAARYHTIVAAFSLGIPTLVIGWHHKYAGVLGLFKQDHCLCSIEELRFEDLVEKFEALWEKRDQVQKTITGLLPDVNDRITIGARAVYKTVLAYSKYPNARCL